LPFPQPHTASTSITGFRLISYTKTRESKVQPELPKLAQQMESARAVWKRDKQNAIPVMLPQGTGQEISGIPVQLAWVFSTHDRSPDALCIGWA
jgi:hypothetical protein